MINKNISGNNKKELPHILMNTSNFKTINVCLKIKTIPSNDLIFARGSMKNLSSDKKFLDKICENGEYGNSILFNTETKPSVMDIVKPNLVKFSQDGFTKKQYKKSFEKNGLLNMNLRKNKSNEP